MYNMLLLKLVLYLHLLLPMIDNRDNRAVVYDRSAKSVAIMKISSYHEVSLQLVYHCFIKKSLTIETCVLNCKSNTDLLNNSLHCNTTGCIAKLFTNWNNANKVHYKCELAFVNRTRLVFLEKLLKLFLKLGLLKSFETGSYTFCSTRIFQVHPVEFSVFLFRMSGPLSRVALKSCDRPSLG